VATNPPRNNRPDSSGESGLASSSADVNGNPPDLASWGSAAGFHQYAATFCFEAGGTIQTQSSVTPVPVGAPANECLVADPVLTAVMIPFPAKLTVPQTRFLPEPPAPPAPKYENLPAYLTVTYHECPTGLLLRWVLVGFHWVFSGFLRFVFLAQWLESASLGLCFQ